MKMLSRRFLLRSYMTLSEIVENADVDEFKHAMAFPRRLASGSARTVLILSYGFPQAINTGKLRRP
jgi:hypothetical protein